MKNQVNNNPSLLNNQERRVSIPAGSDMNSQVINDHGQIFNPESILPSCKVDPQRKIDRPPALIEILSNGKAVPAFTLGNFSIIIGKAKSKKTFLLTCLTSAAISGRIILGSIKGCMPAAKQDILYFDTEQSEYHLYKTINRICLLSGKKNPENLEVYGLRKFTPNQRLILIEYAIYNNPSIGLVVIDGLRDLLTKGINDEEEATTISSKLLKWTAELDIHIIQVLHQNKVDNNARGHVGTECLNKAETTISLTRCPTDAEMSVVTCEYSRDIPFEPFAFRIDESGLPAECEIPVKTARVKNITEPSKISKDRHFSVLDKIFKTNPELKYAETWEAIKTGFKEIDLNFGNNRAKDFLEYYISQEWIKKDEGKKVYKCVRTV